MIKTFTLIVNYSDSDGDRIHRRFENISRVAVDTFTDYFNKKYPESLSWDLEEYHG